MSHNNSIVLPNTSAVASGTFGGPLQVLFDEAIGDGQVAHEVWSHAWGRAIAYAWQKPEQKAALLADPAAVLEKFNYKLPEGVTLIVIEANEARKSVDINRTAGHLAYSSTNLDNYVGYLIKGDLEYNCKYLVRFNLMTTKDNQLIQEANCPVNGWVDIPASGLVIKQSSESYYWVVEKNTVVDPMKQHCAPTINQFLDKQNLEIGGTAPEYFRLASTVVMTLPPAPALENQMMSLMDYDALGKIYPFTC